MISDNHKRCLPTTTVTPTPASPGRTARHGSTARDASTTPVFLVGLTSGVT